MPFFSSSVDSLKHDSLFVISLESFCFPNSLVIISSLFLSIKK